MNGLSEPAGCNTVGCIPVAPSWKAYPSVVVVLVVVAVVFSSIERVNTGHFFLAFSCIPLVLFFSLRPFMSTFAPLLNVSH